MGKYLPRKVSSEEIETRLGIPLGWSKRYSGVEERHQVTTEHIGLMGALAADDALSKANIKLDDIDLLISAGGTYDYPLPNQASVIKAEMKDGGTANCPAIDIDSTCLSFVAALDMASALLDGERFKNILIVSAEMASKGLNSKNWETSTLFGDAAIAAIVTATDTGDSVFVKGAQKTYSEGVYHTLIEGGGARYHFSEKSYDPDFHSFRMNGKPLLRMAKAKIPEFMDEFFSDIPYSLETLDAIVPHQASKTGMAIFESQYKFLNGTVKKTLSTHGNCIAASIPLTLYEAIEKGEVKRGDSCFLCGTSAGFSIGGVLIKY